MKEIFTIIKSFLRCPKPASIHDPNQRSITETKTLETVSRQTNQCINM